MTNRSKNYVTLDKLNLEFPVATHYSGVKVELLKTGDFMRILSNLTLTLMPILFTALTLFAADGGGAPGGGDLIDNIPIDIWSNQGAKKVRFDDLFGASKTKQLLGRVNNLSPQLANELVNCTSVKQWVATNRPLKKGLVSSTTDIPEDRRFRIAQQNKYEIRIDNTKLTQLQKMSDPTTEDMIGTLWLHEMVRCLFQEKNLPEDDEKIQTLTYDLTTSSNGDETVRLLYKMGLPYFKTKSQHDKKEAREQLRIALIETINNSLRECSIILKETREKLNSSEDKDPTLIKLQFYDRALQLSDKIILAVADLRKMLDTSIELDERSSLRLDLFNYENKRCRYTN